MVHELVVSVLDLVSMRPGESAGSAIARSVDLARHVEAWGYKRYWLAEHHSIAGLACSATSVLIGHVAAATHSIRVGSGGVLLPNHAPLLVAQQFRPPQAPHPRPIDLGLRPAPRGAFHTIRAPRPPQRFLRRIRNNPVELLPPVDSMEPLWHEGERAAVEQRLDSAIVGSNATVKAGLEKLIESPGADEVIAVTDLYEHADRLD